MRTTITEQGLKIASKRLGILAAEYLRHFNGGERWCSLHRRWCPADAFNVSDRRPLGVHHSCRQAVSEYGRERYRKRIGREPRRYATRAWGVAS